MQENEFEKKLQQKMDKLQLQPADEVWQKIQEQVAVKKRKRRGVLFFFILSGLIIAGITLFNNPDILNNKKLVAANEKEAAIQKTEQRSANDQPVTNPSLQEQQPPASVVENTGGNYNNSPAPVTVTGTSLAKSKLIRSVRKGSAKMNVVSTQPDGIDGNTNDISMTTSPVEKSNSSAIADAGNDAVPNIMTNKTDTLVTIKTDEPVIELLKKEPSQKDDPPANKTTDKEKKDRKWGLSIVAAGGMSATGSNYLKNGVYESDGLGSTPTSGSNGGNVYVPSKTSAGISLMAGIQLYRNISAKSRLIAGLQYRLINTSIKTGQAVTSGTTFYDGYAYRTGAAKKYNNRYHFISLPLTFSTTLFSIGQHDIRFDAGLSYSRLLSTNALNFNAAQGVYYKDAAVFNKSQWGVNTALAFNLSGQNKAAFYIGPELYYSITPLSSSGIYSKAHSSFIGLRLQKHLKK